MAILETERLRIRPFTMDDVEDVRREVYTDPEVWGPRSLDAVRDGVMLAVLLGDDDNEPWAKRAVERKSDGAFLGQVRLDPYVNSFYRWAEEPTPRYNTVEVELSFAFGKRYWGQSYAFEACTAMIRYAFETVKLPRLVGGTGEENLRSVNLHRRLGYRVFPALTLEGKENPGSGYVAVLENDQV